MNYAKILKGNSCHNPAGKGGGQFCSSGSKINTDNWIPASGGTEKPFTTRTGKKLWYMWNTSTGEHKYLDVDNDIFLDDKDVESAFGMR
jgi:hypothetical protein